MFKYDIDFGSDLDADDRFSAVVDQTWRDGQLVDTGPVLAATFTVDGKLHSAFRFVRDGKAEYFTSDGRSLRRAFIRMPIPYARITSGFGMRKHPILGRMRGHMGIDYAASSGTPIMAAGDARVAVRRLEGRLRARGDPRPRPRLHHPVRAHVGVRQRSSPASASRRAR